MGHLFILALDLHGFYLKKMLSGENWVDADNKRDPIK